MEEFRISYRRKRPRKRKNPEKEDSEVSERVFKANRAFRLKSLDIP
jgi:hypothetical protein